MAPRRRAALPDGALTTLGQKLMVLPALAVVYSGIVLLALAAGASGASLDRWTGAGWVYEQLSLVDPARWSQQTAIIVGVAAIVSAGLLLVLGWAQRLVPHRTRREVELAHGELGETTVHPRAFERAVESAALEQAAVRGARATFGDDGIALQLHTSATTTLPDLLRETQQRARAALATAGLGDHIPVTVTVTQRTSLSRSETLR